MRAKLPMLFMLLMMPPLISGCAITTPTGNMCAMEGLDIPDAGFEQRWSRAEKEFAETHNEIYRRECQ